jgi:NAD(P)-dependent dehydrogenase (short-subunit alcohol dehydrogenase family)
VDIINARYPDGFTAAALDYAQGTDADDLHAGEVRAVRTAISQLDALAELLRGIESEDGTLNIAAWNAGDVLEAVSAKLGRVV